MTMFERAIAAEAALAQQLAAIVHEFGYERGDLVEQYARDQMVRKLSAVVAAAEQAAARKALEDAARDYPWRDAGGITDAPGGARHWLKERAATYDPEPEA